MFGVKLCFKYSSVCVMFLLVIYFWMCFWFCMFHMYNWFLVNLFLCLACWVVTIVYLWNLFSKYMSVMFLASLIQNNIKIRNNMSFLIFLWFKTCFWVSKMYIMVWIFIIGFVGINRIFMTQTCVCFVLSQSQPLPRSM